MRTGRKTGVVGGVLCALTGALPACGPDATSSGEDAVAGPDNVGVVQEALFESACWSLAVPNATIKAAEGRYYADSTDASYGLAACPHQYVVELTNVLGHSFEIDAQPSGQYGSNWDWCRGFWEYTRAMGWNGTAWQQIDNYSEVGLYTGGFIFLPYCTESITGGHRPDIHSASHGFSKVRIVTQGGWAESFQPVSVAINIDL